jgi:hypothetical protein
MMPRQWQKTSEQQCQVGVLPQLGTVVLVAAIWVVGLSVSSPAHGQEQVPVESSKASAEPADGAGLAKEISPAKDIDELLTRWTQAIRVGDARELRVLVDWERIFEQATDGYASAFTQKAIFRRSFLNAANRGEPLQFCAREVARGGSYRLLRRDESSAIFRLIYADGTLNYHRLSFDPKASPVKVADLEIALTGEPISQVFRRNFERVVTPDEELFDGPFDRTLLQGVRLLQEMSQSLHEGKGGETWELYDELPEIFQRDKGALLLRIQAARELRDNDRLVVACDAYCERFPDAKFAAFAKLCACLLRDDARGSREALDEIPEPYSTDPYIDVVRAEILLDEGDLPAARKAAERAAADPAGAPFGAWAMLSVQMRAAEYEAAAATAAQLVGDVGRAKVDQRLTKDDAAAFRASTAYQEWMATRTP